MPSSQESESSIEVVAKKVDEKESFEKNDVKDEEEVKNGTNKATSDVEKKEEVTESKDETKQKEELINEATALLAQGKRHLFVKDYPAAVTALGDACAKLNELYGAFGSECADAYFSYGCALLELSREESGVLEVDNKEKDSDEGEEDDDDKEKVRDEDNTKEGSSNDKDEGTARESETEETINKEENSEENGETTAEDNEEDEGDVNNLQLAWETFELAKIIFIKQKDDKKLADTYLKLGEVALESENYEIAITDIQHCLDLQKKNLPPVSREIAETCFQLGIACSLCNHFDEAIKHFTSAGVLLEKRIHNLEAMKEPEPEKKKNPFYTTEKEIEEIRALLPEIKDKIADMEDFKNETVKAVVQATLSPTKKSQESAAGSSTNGNQSGSSSSKAPANDISHLVRKKRKTVEETTVGNESKKPHVESDKTS